MYKVIGVLFLTLVLKNCVLCQTNNFDLDAITIGSQGCLGEVKCPTGEYYSPKSTIKGYCGNCVQLPGYNQACNVANECAPGLKCVVNAAGSNCDFDKDSCLYSQFIPLPGKDVIWQPPKCLPDGTYAPVQCKGELMTGRCFCSDAKGNRIFGEQWWRKKENMYCACSRKRVELEAQGRLDVTLHCNSAGGFEELQCDSGVCWCANEHTGSPKKGTVVVPEKMMKLLPCYNALKVGKHYLRKCESAKYAQAAIVNSLKEHGTTAAMTSLYCDYDGSYGLIEFEKAAAYCIWKDNTRISPFQAEAGSGAFLKMNCNCARDTKIYEDEKLEFVKLCDANGNYKPKQHKNGRPYCVDTDGFAITEEFDVDDVIDCEAYTKYLRQPDSKI